MNSSRFIGMQFSHGLNSIVKLADKPLMPLAYYAGTMDIYEIRLANFQQLVAAMLASGMSQKDAAIAMDMSPSFLNQLLKGKKMGDEVARKVEVSKGLTRGHLDREHEIQIQGVREDRAGYASQLLRIDPDTIASALRLLRLAFKNLGMEFDNEADGTPLAYAYQYLLDNQMQSVTAENLIDFSALLAKKLPGSTGNELQAGITRSARRNHS